MLDEAQKITSYSKHKIIQNGTGKKATYTSRVYSNHATDRYTDTSHKSFDSAARHIDSHGTRSEGMDNLKFSGNVLNAIISGEPIQIKDAVSNALTSKIEMSLGDKRIQVAKSLMDEATQK